MAESKWTPKDFDLPNKLLDSKNTNQLIWHTRSVFWELVGVSDMLLQWANTRFGLGLQESQVRWSDMEKRPAKVDNDLWLNVQNIINNEMESAWSFEVKTYRNFSHVSLLIPSSVISKTKGPIGIYLEPARVGALPQDIRLQLDSYIQAMRDFGGKVFSAKLN